MKYSELKRFLELNEQIKTAEKELSALKTAIKTELGPHGGEIDLGGIVATVSLRTTTKTDLEGIAELIGVSKMSEFQTSSQTPVVIVKATAAAIKERKAK